MSSFISFYIFFKDISCIYLLLFFFNKFLQHVFIYSRPIAGIRTKMEHETTYLQTSKWHVKNIFMHLSFKYHTDQRA